MSYSNVKKVTEVRVLLLVSFGMQPVPVMNAHAHRVSWCVHFGGLDRLICDNPFWHGEEGNGNPPNSPFPESSQLRIVSWYYNNARVLGFVFQADGKRISCNNPF